LRAGKATLYEGGVRVAAFATWRGKIESGKKIEAAMHMVDWYPTLLKLAGASLEQPLPLDGRDIWTAITAGAASPHEEILLNATPTHGAIRVGDWKLVLNGQLGATDGEDGPTKARNKRAELFNLRDDPSEKNDLASQRPAELKRLRDRYDAIAREAVPPLSRAKAAGFVSPKVWGQADRAP
jgi:arylsulfatase A-like enzyme